MAKSKIAQAVEQVFNQGATAEPVEPVEQHSEASVADPTPHLNPRAQAMAEIHAKRGVELDAELSQKLPSVTEDGDPIEEPSLEEAAQQANAAAEQVEEQPEQEPLQQQAQTPPGIDPEVEYEFMVDGKPVKIKGSQVIRKVQVEETADQRLELATKLLTAAAQPSKDVAPPAEDEDVALVRAIQFGTEQEALAAIKKLKAPPEDIDRRVQWNMSVNEGRALVQSEYADLFAKPSVAGYFLSEERRLRAQGDRRPHKDLYRDIGESIRRDFNLPKAQTATPARTNEERRQDKVKAPGMPKLASARLEAPSPEKPQTHAERIEAMRRARHQGKVINY